MQTGAGDRGGEEAGRDDVVMRGGMQEYPERRRRVYREHAPVATNDHCHRRIVRVNSPVVD